MIPKGDRNDIETEVKLFDEDETNFNELLAEIAGAKFFLWLKELLISNKYHLGSVFSLVPNFEKCKKEHDYYEHFITRFEEGFDFCVENNEIVPIHDNSQVNIKSVIFDTTGLSTSGIMTDDEFRKFTEMEDYYLPLAILRKDKNFNSFLKHYAEEDQKIELDNLKDLIVKEDFQGWLKVQENNNKFLEFLLSKGYLKDFIDEEILLENDGELYKAEDLYYDIDKYLIDIKAFTDNICYLSKETREYFKNNKEWNEIIADEFDEFDCDEFVDDVLLSQSNEQETSNKLKDINTSIHFYKFLAENVGYSEKYLMLPFFNDQDELVDDFEDKFVFFSSVNEHSVCDSEWMSSIDIEIISQKYISSTNSYFKNHFGVQDFSNEFVIKNIISSDDYHDSIADAIAEDFDISNDFITYCYSNKNLFKYGDLRNYSLHVYDGDGDEQWCLTEDNIFFPSDLYDELSSKEWIDSDWMYVLNENYIKDQKDHDDFKIFLSQKVCIEDISEKNFYENVVKENLKDIIVNTSGSNDADGHKNIDFVKYLDNNYHLIFKEKKDNDNFGNLILLSSEFSDIDIDVDFNNRYIFDDELKSIIENCWFPKDLVYMCNQQYGKSEALLAIGVKEYKFTEFYIDVIVAELDSINANFDEKEDNIAFHNFIIDHLGSLASDQQSKMMKANVFLYGNNNVASSAGGHKILSANAKELFAKGLVEFSDLDIIDPDYKTENSVEYWETRLENTKFTVNHFFVWMKENIDTFKETLQDETLNIEFWRWLKSNVADKLVKDASCLPVLLKDETIGNSSDTVYFSDEYMNDAGIEYTVKIFDENASFISPKYINDGDDVEEWKIFWAKIGVKFEIVDILVETVIPSLSSIDDENLPKLIAENRDVLEKSYEDGLISQLTNLRIKAHDGSFYSLKDTIYIDCEKEEPFLYIKFPNQITFKTADERRLIKNILDEIDGDCIGTLSKWMQRKLDCYLNMQKNDKKSLIVIHDQFIDDLSLIRNNKQESLKDIEHLEDIQLLNKNNDFCDAETLTMGSIYKPFFDFEACGVESLDYVSDTYNTNCTQYTGKLFRELHMHCDFQERDIRLLTDRICSVYFWSNYLTKKNQSTSQIKTLISDKLFDNLACIPTKDYMKTPKDLYNGLNVSKYIKRIEGWENKIPLKNLPEIKNSDNTTLFGVLPFKNSLDFLDALYALVTISGQEKRTQLLEWMIGSYDESYNSKILEYRDDEHALWCNNSNEKVHIKDLYALDYCNKSLDQYFGANPHIINKSYFPTGELFNKACDILGIKIITSEDLKMEPIGEVLYTARDKDLKIFALIIAGITDNENWLSRYNSYCEKLSRLTLHRCKSIMITYKDDEAINQSLRKFYHKEGSNDFYFVESLDGKRVYTLFVKEYIKFLEIAVDDIAEDLVEDIMDNRDNAIEIVKEQNTLMLDAGFKDELGKLIPSIKRDLSGNVAEEDDAEDINFRPAFTISSENEYAESEYSGSENQNDNSGIDSDHHQLSSTSSIGSLNENLDNNTDNTIKSGSTKVRSDKGQTHNYPNEQNRCEKTSRTNLNTKNNENKCHEYSDMDDNRGGAYKAPKPFSLEDVQNFRSHGITRTLETLESTISEVDEINRILGENLSSEQVADQNYLAQLRLYNNLKNKGMIPNESKDDFVRNKHMKNEHLMRGGKYIHKCSAAGGIMYLSPSIWNKVIDDKCVVCVYLGAKANEFMYFNSSEDILKWIGEDDIVIKLTGDEKANVVEELYSGLLDGVKGTAYTLIRINSNEKYNSVFAPISNNVIDDNKENEDEY